jgi:hypothetical protein
MNYIPLPGIQVINSPDNDKRPDCSGDYVPERLGQSSISWLEASHSGGRATVIVPSHIHIHGGRFYDPLGYFDDQII